MVRPLLKHIYLSLCRKIAVAYFSCFGFPNDDKERPGTVISHQNPAGCLEERRLPRHCLPPQRSPPSAVTKVSCGEFVADLCSPAYDALKAVVTHCGNSLLEAQPNVIVALLWSEVP